MAERRQFNPSLRMPVIDIIVAVLLIVMAGYFWFQTSGREKLAEGFEGWRESQAGNRAEVDETLATLDSARMELERTKAQRDERAEESRWLEEQCTLEHERITEGQRLDQEYTDRLLDQRLEIQRVRDQRAALNTDLFEAEGQIREAEEAIAALETQTQERNREVARLDNWITEAQAALDADPPSRFPERSSLSSVVEIAGIGDDPEQLYVVSLASGIKRVGTLDVGLLGSLGLGSGAESSLKEGGLFANMLLAHRRASLDFEGGISQLSSRLLDDSKTGPFAGATLRFAPLRRERLFLLAGTRYSHEDLGLRLGLGLGRR